MNHEIPRRDFLRTVTAAGATLGILGNSERATASEATSQNCPEPPFPQLQKLTASVADFVVNTKYSDIPAETQELGKK